MDLYVTLGASEHAMIGDDPTHRVEYFVGLLPGRDEIASPLAALSLYAAREETSVRHGDTVLADGPLWPGSDVRTFLVLRQREEVLPTLALQGGIHVEPLQAIPIHDAERRFTVAHGADALLSRWEQRNVPFWDPRRNADPAS